MPHPTETQFAVLDCHTHVEILDYENLPQGNAVLVRDSYGHEQWVDFQRVDLIP